MKIAVWRTKHEIATTVADAVNDGLSSHGLYLDLDTDEMFPDDVDIHIGYGILRGMDDVFRACQKAGKPFIHIDRGYFKPGHFDGYYRISLNGTQQTTWLDRLEPDYARWDALGIEILNSKNHHGKILLCTPTQHVQDFFNIICHITSVDESNYLWRPKNCQRQLQQDLYKCSEVITFNSSVGWEALRQGIPVVSDPDHSIVGAWQKTLVKNQYLDYDERRRLFAIMASLQLTLEEIRSGLLWPLIQKLLTCSSDLTAEKALLQTSAPTVS